MAIYNKNGQALQSAYGIDGRVLQSAYNIDGNLVYNATPTIDYDDYTYESLYTVSGITSHTQGMDIYDGVIVAFKADNLMYTFNLSDGSVIGSAITAKSEHGGSASFSDVFYDESDRFPLLYVSSDLTPCEIYVNRITTTSSTLIRTLVLPLDKAGYYGKATLNGNALYCLGYKENSYTSDGGGSNKVIISKWDLSNLTDNGDGTYTPAYVSSFERAFIYVLQFVTFHDGMIWAGSGYGSPNASHVYALRLDNGAILHTITLPNTVEIEGAAFVKDIDDTYYLVVLQWGGVFLKYTFAYN